MYKMCVEPYTYRRSCVVSLVRVLSAAPTISYVLGSLDSIFFNRVHGGKRERRLSSTASLQSKCVEDLLPFLTNTVGDPCPYLWSLDCSGVPSHNRRGLAN